MKFSKDNLILYGVTDSRWLHGQTLAQAVEESLKGGVTMVQLREKHADKETMISLAKELKEVCHAYGALLIINDSVEVAMAVDADGVHIGQSDMACRKARLVLGPDKIIGVTAKTKEQALAAQEAGADYLGSGAMFPTGSKDDAVVITPDGLDAITSAVSIPVVAIGGITKENIGSLKGHGIAGAAVVSAVYAQENVKEAALDLRERLKDVLK